MSAFSKPVALALCGLGLSASSLAAQTTSDTLARIRETRSISMGYRESSVPFAYLDAQQRPVGFSIDLCMAVVERIKTQLGLPQLAIQYVAVNSSNRIPLVQNGTVDLECGSTANNLTRQREVGFSVATFISQTRWLVRTNSGLRSAADLRGKTIVTTQGSNAVGFARRINDENRLELRILQARDHAESFLMLETGRAVAFLEDDILLAGMRASARGPTEFAMLPDAYDVIPYGLMFRRGDAAFKALVDEVLAGLMRSGEFERIYARWFESPIPPRNINLEFPVTDMLRERIRNPSDRVEN